MLPIRGCRGIESDRDDGEQVQVAQPSPSIHKRKSDFPAWIALDCRSASLHAFPDRFLLADLTPIARAKKDVAP